MLSLRMGPGPKGSFFSSSLQLKKLCQPPVEKYWTKAILGAQGRVSLEAAYALGQERGREGCWVAIVTLWEGNEIARG